MILLLILLSMFGGAPEPEPIERKPWNVDSIKTSSQQQNIPVTYFAGTMPCPVDWVTDAHNWTSRNVSTGGSGKGGKGGGGGQSSQKNWYCDGAGTTNFCPDDAPNDALLVVLVNGEIASSGPLYRAPGSHYVAFSLAKFCPACRFYWGTKDQPRDDLVISHITGELHSAYRNQGLLTFKQWFTGSSPNLQSIVLILARGAKYFETRFESGESGVNPMGMAYELWTDEAMGFGQPAAKLHRAGFDAVADACTAEGLQITPKLLQPASGRSILATLNQYYDGWWRFTGGQVEPGFFSHGDVDVDALPELGSHEIIGEASITPGKLRDTKNVVFVTYCNRELAHKDDDTDGVIDHENYLKQKRAVNERLDRRWILYGPDAIKHASAWVRVVSKEKHTGNLNARRDKVTALRQGLRFKSNLDSLELSFVWRIIARETATDRAGAVKFILENERGIHPAQFLPDPAPGPPGFIIVPSAIANARIVELRTGLRLINAGLQVAVLAQRPSQFILGAKIHLSLDDDNYEHIATMHVFAAYGEVAIDYPSTTGDLDTTVGLVVDLSGEDMDIVSSQSDPERDDNRLLAFCDNEIFSVGQTTSLGSDRVKIFNRRARYGTTKAAHSVGAPVYFIRRAFLQPIAHSSFVAGATRYFKLQPYVSGGDYDLDLVDPIAYTFHTSAPIGGVFNLALTSHAYVDVQGEMHAVILAAWDFPADQDIILFGVAYRPTSAIGLIYNEEQNLSFALTAKGATAAEAHVELGATGTVDAPSLVRLWNEEQELYFDLICTGAAGAEITEFIPAADAAPGIGLRLFNPALNLWFDVLCLGAAGFEYLGLSEGEIGLSLDPSPLSGDLDSLAVPSTPWSYIAIDVPDLAIPVVAGVSYEVKVRPINSWGEAGDYCDPEQIIAGMIDLFQIANLRIAGQDPGDHVLHGVDCHFVWDLVSPAQGITIEGGPDGVTRGPWDPGLVDFEIKIYKDQLTLEQIEAGEYIPPGGVDPVPVVRIWRDVPIALSYDFSLGKNIASAAGPHPIFTAWVGGFDAANRSAAPQVFYVTKEAPPVGSNVEMNAAIGAIDLSWTNPDVLGLDHIRIDINGSLTGNVRRVPYPGTYHHVIPLTNGSSYKFLLRWVDKFGLASAILETGWSPSVGGGSGSGLPAVTFDPDGEAIDNTTAIVLSHPTAAIYWRRDDVTPTTADNLYTAPIEVDPPGSEDPFDITAIAYLDGLYGPPATRNFLPYTPGGGGPPPDRPSIAYCTPGTGTYHVDPVDYLDIDVTSDNDGTWCIFYTYTVGSGSTPGTPTHSGFTPGPGTHRTFSAHETIRIDDPTDGFYRIKLLVYKPSAAIPDSPVSFFQYFIIHS